MEYFRAREVDYKPFIVWDIVARSENEYTGRGLHKDPLVIKQSSRPDTKYGVCLQKIQGSRLVNRTADEIAQYRESFEDSIRQTHNKKIDTETKFEYFEFDNRKFSLSIAAQTNWNRIMSEFAIGIYSSEHPNVISTYDNKEYTLSESYVVKFMNAYSKRINEILALARSKKQ